MNSSVWQQHGHQRGEKAWALGSNINSRGTLKPFWLHNYWHCLITDLGLGEKTNLILQLMIIWEIFFPSMPWHFFFLPFMILLISLPLSLSFQWHHFIPQMDTTYCLCPPHSMSALPLEAYCLCLWPGAFCLLAFLLPNMSIKKCNVWTGSKKTW